LTNNKTTIYGYDHTQQTSKRVSENGILISETTFEYDAQGRMSVVTVTLGNRIEITEYEYGTDGIRVSAEHEVWEDGELKSKTKTEYLNDPLNITGYSQVLKQTETDIVSGEETVTTYVIGHQRISQTVKEGNNEPQEYYFTFDGHGSTRALLDFTGAIVHLYSFDAYGNALGFDPNQALTEFLYSGEQFDSKIEQQYLRARYYDPATGRFNRLDPFFGNLNDPQSFHKYTYAHNNPVNMTDPTGMFGLGGMSLSISIGASIGAGIGAAIGFQRTGSIFSWETLIGTGIGASAGLAFVFSPFIFGILSPTGIGALASPSITTLLTWGKSTLMTFAVRIGFTAIQKFGTSLYLESLLLPSLKEFQRIAIDARAYDFLLRPVSGTIDTLATRAVKGLHKVIYPDWTEYVMACSGAQLGMGFNLIMGASP
jgi:RHS repeat-associated protein